MISAVKAADDGDGLVVRLYEPAGAHAGASVRLGAGAGGRLTAAARADSLERDMAEVVLGRDGVVELELRPFELVTLRLSPAGGDP